jgi:MFS family permease
MTGMLVGGFLWGILGDKKGRLSVLFGYILIYSLANFANAFVPNMTWYAVVRFIAGMGLAGELGAGITLVNESMTKEKRGYGTMLVVSFGALGAIVASFVGSLSWTMAYIIGGSLGLALLILRVSVMESGMYSALKEQSVARGNFFYLFADRKRAIKYVLSILVGLPIWFIVGLLIILSPELSKAIGVTPALIGAGGAVLWCYVGLSSGDLLSGLLSQWLKSRKKVIFIYMAMSLAATIAYVFSRDISIGMFYFLCFALGFGTGFWALFVTMASEQFGTNLRAMVTTTAPNFVRGSVVPITMGYTALHTSGLSLLNSALIVGVVCMALAAMGLWRLEDTFGKDLNYTE